MSFPWKWKWPCLLTLCTCAAGISYFELDPRSMVQYGLRIFFKLAIAGLFLSFIINKIYHIWYKHRYSHGHTESGSETGHEEVYSERQKQIRDDAQIQNNEKVCSYKERILDPREEAKRLKKEADFLHFTGPAWKGKGEALGGADGRNQSELDEGAGGEAREIRKLPESVILHNPRVEPVITKRVIKLPDEPDSDTDGITTIVLRTPLGTSHKRRFLSSCTLQTVFDYMTTLGFKDKLYTLSTMYPRQQLTDFVGQALHDLDLGVKVVLNIEEI